MKMHMSDALISPTVGAAMWTASAGLIAYSSRKLKEEADDRKIPLMGVLGAFIFAAQMINFTIPGTGSSGHLGGGMILSVLLGGHGAFLVMASVLVVQALFFGDGGLLALGSNIFNLGFFPCFVVYPLVYKQIAGPVPSRKRIMTGSVLAAVAGLQLGAFGVVLETSLSGVSSLPFSTFALMMQPIHLAIGLVEGVVTATVVAFVWQARPEILQSARETRPIGAVPLRSVLLTLLAAAVLTGGVLAWFASEHPDGLEWAIAGVTGAEELPEAGHGVHGALAALQEKLAVLPDYALPAKAGEVVADGRLGTSVSGIVGGIITLVLCALIGVLLRRSRKRPTPPAH
jgi:cobalt/nickel transport system permease protein